jgi:hypothetical protein
MRTAWIKLCEELAADMAATSRQLALRESAIRLIDTMNFYDLTIPVRLVTDVILGLLKQHPAGMWNGVGYTSITRFILERADQGYLHHDIERLLLSRMEPMAISNSNLLELFFLTSGLRSRSAAVALITKANTTSYPQPLTLLFRLRRYVYSAPRLVLLFAGMLGDNVQEHEEKDEPVEIEGLFNWILEKRFACTPLLSSVVYVKFQRWFPVNYGKYMGKLIMADNSSAISSFSGRLLLHSLSPEVLPATPVSLIRDVMTSTCQLVLQTFSVARGIPHPLLAHARRVAAHLAELAAGATRERFLNVSDDKNRVTLYRTYHNQFIAMADTHLLEATGEVADLQATVTWGEESTDHPYLIPRVFAGSVILVQFRRAEYRSETPMSRWITAALATLYFVIASTDKDVYHSLLSQLALTPTLVQELAEASRREFVFFCPTGLAAGAARAVAGVTFLDGDNNPIHPDTRLIEFDSVMSGASVLAIEMTRKTVKFIDAIRFTHRPDWRGQIPTEAIWTAGLGLKPAQEGIAIAAGIMDMFDNFFEAVNPDSAAHTLLHHYCRAGVEFPLAFLLHAAVLGSAEFLIRYDVYWWSRGRPTDSNSYPTFHVRIGHNFYDSSWRTICQLGANSAFAEFVLDNAEQREPWLDLFIAECRGHPQRHAAMGWIFARKIIAALTFPEGVVRFSLPMKLLSELEDSDKSAEANSCASGFNILINRARFVEYFQGCTSLLARLPI